MARTRRASRTGHSAPETVRPGEQDAETFIGPSPDPRTNLILADIALQGGSLLVRRGLERGFLGRKYAPDKAARILKRRSMGESLIGAAIVKLATRSVPGAILVGGGLLAKTLYDRRKDNRAAPGATGATGMADPAPASEDQPEEAENERRQG